MGCWQCLPLSVVQLKGKHYQKPHCRNGSFRYVWAMSYACMPVLQKKLKWSRLYFQMEKTSLKKISTHCQRRKRFSQTLKRRQKKRMNDCAVSWTNLARKQDWKGFQSPKLWIIFPNCRFLITLWLQENFLKHEYPRFVQLCYKTMLCYVPKAQGYSIPYS